MKNSFYLIFFTILLVSCSSTKPRKRDIVSLSFSYDSTHALEYTNTIPLQIKLLRRDGTIKSAHRNNSDKVIVLSPQGIQKGRNFYFDRAKASDNNNSVDLFLFYRKDSSITLKEQVAIPYITELRFQQTTSLCYPGKISQPKLEVTHNTEKRRTITIRDGSRARPQQPVETELLTQIQCKPTNLRILSEGVTPQIKMDSLITTARLIASAASDTTTSDTLSLTISYNIQKHFAFDGRSGYNGRDGANGQDGTIGRDGGDGGHGGHGHAGTNGHDVKLYLLSEQKDAQVYLKIWASARNKQDSVILNTQTGHLHISSNGGNGGNGGDGGSGGDGGDADSTHSKGDGGNGGDGGHGGIGGRGGKITLYCDSLANQYLHAISYENFGGQGGNGGTGGADGDDGKGSGTKYKTKAGAVLGFLGTVAKAVFLGNSGENGKAGYAGDTGPTLEVEILSSEKVLAKIAQFRKIPPLKKYP